MIELFPYKTISEENINISNISYSYGNKVNVEKIDNWDKDNFDLTISINVSIDDNLSEYISEKENASWLITWRSDDKFTGTGKRIKVINKLSQEVVCNIPFGIIAKGLTISLYIVTSIKEKNFKEASRPDGCIIASKNIYDENVAGSYMFPIREYKDDGKYLFKWDRMNLSDFNVSAQYALEVCIDLNHPFIKNSKDYKMTSQFILLMILDSLFHITINEDVFDRLVDNNTDEFDNYSIGKTLVNLLKTFSYELNLTNIKDLKYYYKSDPVRTITSFHSFFSKAIINLPNETATI